MRIVLLENKTIILKERLSGSLCMFKYLLALVWFTICTKHLQTSSLVGDLSHLFH